MDDLMPAKPAKPAMRAYAEMWALPALPAFSYRNAGMRAHTVAKMWREALRDLTRLPFAVAAPVVSSPLRPEPHHE